MGTHIGTDAQELNSSSSSRDLCRNPKTNHHSQTLSITMYHIIYLYNFVYFVYVCHICQKMSNCHNSKSLMLEVDDPDETVGSGTTHSTWRCKGQLRDHPQGKIKAWRSKWYLDHIWIKWHIGCIWLYASCTNACTILNIFSILKQ